MKGDIYPYYRIGRDGVRRQIGWQVRFGREITKFFKDRGEAERFLTGIRYETDRGTFDRRDYMKSNPLAFDKLANQWLDFKEGRIKKTSFAPLRNYIFQAIEVWGDANIKTIGYGETEDFLFKRTDISEKTRNNMRACLGQFRKWVEKRHGISAPDMPAVPFELGWRNITDVETQKTIINKVREISFHIDPKIWFGISFLATYIQVRPGELINIKEKHIDLSLGAIIIPHPKEKKPKLILLDSEDAEFIKAFPVALPDLYFFRHTDGRKYGVHYLWKWWKKACKELGIEGVDLYGGTRHSTVTKLGQMLTPEQIKDATGHTSKAFERYFQDRQKRALAVTKTIKGIQNRQQPVNNENNVIKLDK